MASTSPVWVVLAEDCGAKLPAAEAVGAMARSGECIALRTFPRMRYVRGLN